MSFHDHYLMQKIGWGVLYTGKFFFNRLKIMHFQCLVTLYPGKSFLEGVKIHTKLSGSALYSKSTNNTSIYGSHLFRFWEVGHFEKFSAPPYNNLRGSEKQTNFLCLQVIKFLPLIFHRIYELGI